MSANTNLQTEAEVVEFLKTGPQETLRLDFKAADSLGKSDGKKNEISKDISAFANSAGGVIIYGIDEPSVGIFDLRSGITDDNFNREWLDQVITSRISPRLETYRIDKINLTLGGFILVVTIAQGNARAPHQASDYKYYKRYQARSEPMEDYEVKDIMRRASVARLDIAWRLDQTLIQGGTLFRYKLAFQLENNSQLTAKYPYLYFSDLLRGSIVNTPAPRYNRSQEGKWVCFFGGANDVVNPGTKSTVCWCDPGIWRQNNQFGIGPGPGSQAVFDGVFFTAMYRHGCESAWRWALTGS